jgi:hypothetical protein
MTALAAGSGTAADPGSDHAARQVRFEAWRDETPTRLPGGQVGTTQLRYYLRIDDLHAMPGAATGCAGQATSKVSAGRDGWAWGRSPDNPVGSWYGMKKACQAGSATTCRRCWRWDSPRSSTTPATTDARPLRTPPPANGPRPATARAGGGGC